MAQQERGRMPHTIVSALIMVMIAAGCSMSNYGRLKSDPEVTRLFEAYQILPQYKYCYRGSYDRPSVIVGINANYVLDSKLWVEIDPKSKKFRALIDKVSLQGGSSTIQPWGFIILDAAGNKVGVWYSALRGATVEVGKNGRITKLLPMPAATRGNQPR